MQQEPVRQRGRVSTVAWTASGIAVGSIWLAVVLASIYAPDLISGSQQEHLPLVGWLDWIWGTIATAFVVLAVLHGFRLGAAGPMSWWALGVGTAAVWLGVLVVTLLGPVMVTGSDPTHVPLVAMGVPILGIFFTWFICALVKAAFEQET